MHCNPKMTCSVSVDAVLTLTLSVKGLIAYFHCRVGFGLGFPIAAVPILGTDLYVMESSE